MGLGLLIFDPHDDSDYDLSYMICHILLLGITTILLLIAVSISLRLFVVVIATASCTQAPNVNPGRV